MVTITSRAVRVSIFLVLFKCSFVLELGQIVITHRYQSRGATHEPGSKLRSQEMRFPERELVEKNKRRFSCCERFFSSGRGRDSIPSAQTSPVQGAEGVHTSHTAVHSDSRYVAVARESRDRRAPLIVRRRTFPFPGRDSRQYFGRQKHSSRRKMATDPDDVRGE